MKKIGRVLKVFLYLFKNCVLICFWLFLLTKRVLKRWYFCLKTFELHLQLEREVSVVNSFRRPYQLKHTKAFFEALFTPTLNQIASGHKIHIGQGFYLHPRKLTSERFLKRSEAASRRSLTNRIVVHTIPDSGVGSRHETVSGILCALSD